MMSIDLDQTQSTPFPQVPAFDDVATPATPKRVRRTSVALNRRVRANIGALGIPNISAMGSGPLRLEPQKRSIMGSSYEKLLLGGALRHKNSQASKTISSSKAKTSLRTPPRTVVSAPMKTTMKTGNISLMSLRMAAMLKGSSDAKAQLKFGQTLSFSPPGRARSSPYRPSRSMPVRNRSFHAVSA